MKNFKKHIYIGLIGIFIFSSVAFKTDFFEIAKQLDIYSSLFKELNMYYIDEINPAELNEIAIKNMLKSLDPYTNFYDEQGIEDVRIKRSGEYGGIGSYTRYKDKKLYILEPYKESPAAKAGLKAGDEILQIDDVIVKEYEGKSVGNLLRGIPDTELQLKVLRQGKELEIAVKRAKIEINPVPFYSMVDEEVGYIALVKFNKKTTKQVTEAFQDLKKQGMKELILDLRGNPGGLLSEAVNITNLFVPKNKVVVTTKSKVKKWNSTYKTKRDALDAEIPVIILVNGRSASASEIVSGSLQDYDRAVIMGERSFGKGLVQRYRELTYGTQMKLTISKYYTPSGRCIQELDYANRSKDGKVPKFSDGKVNVFKTANGRKVFDGGGVLPDVVIDKPKTLEITKELYKSDALFNYVTNYYYQHPTVEEPDKFVLDNNSYDGFMQYIKNHGDEFQTKTEKTLEKAMENAEKDGFEKSLSADFESFKENVTAKKIRQMVQNKQEIVEYLTEEIVKRYYYKEGVYQQKMAFDPVIVQATELLHDNKKYAKILK